VAAGVLPQPPRSSRGNIFSLPGCIPVSDPSQARLGFRPSRACSANDATLAARRWTNLRKKNAGLLNRPRLESVGPAVHADPR
jgi:hypothetical protein